MYPLLSRYLTKPPIYTPSTGKFWDDPHISKGMLEAHLNANWDAASRKTAFIEKSVHFISEAEPPVEYPNLLDLGCGPGLYAERFHQAGYSVTGIDFSQRSIAYAKEQAAVNGHSITYRYQNYLDLDYFEQFDLITLIYCDFGVLSTDERRQLLNNVYQALKPGGKFILDVFTPAQHEGKAESKEWANYDNGGFWNGEPHLCLNSFYRYDEDDTVLAQTIVVHGDDVDCYNIWEHCFTSEALIGELKHGGFGRIDLYGNVAGEAYDPEGAVICAVAVK
ncbi:Cypemycin methyltransferase [compost metagenome]